MQTTRAPLYNLKTVVHETGLKAATLRAWERRYGLPSPGRSPGGQRLYSGRDIDTLRWLSSQLQKGARIRQAVDQWRQAEAAGRDPLAEALQPAAAVPSPSSLAALRAQWLEACRRFDEAGADAVLNQAFALYPLEAACVQLLQAGLSQIGTDWFTGRASVQVEHFASALAMRRVEALFAAAPPATRPQTVLVGCPAGEWHTFAALLMVLFLRRRGLHVIYLGADLPAGYMLAAVRQVKPDLVVLAAQTLISAASLLEAVRLLRAENFSAAYGGWVFTRQPELCERIPAHYLGGDLEGAVLLADRLAAESSPASAPGEQEVPAALLDAFNQKRPQIETSVMEGLEDSGIQRQRLWNANLFLGNDIQAALQLGEVGFLEMDLRWIRELLNPEPGLQQALGVYLQAYRAALRLHLGEEGILLTAWEGWDFLHSSS